MEIVPGTGNLANYLVIVNGRLLEENQGGLGKVHKVSTLHRPKKTWSMKSSLPQEEQTKWLCSAKPSPVKTHTSNTDGLSLQRTLFLK